MKINLSSSFRKQILSFIIAAGILSTVYACTLVYPFGDGSVLALDLNGQYISYFEAYRRALIGEGSLFYSWSRNLSGEFYGMFCYYLASPLNLIVLLFPRAYITEAVALIIIIKVGLASASFQYSRNGSIIFSLLYGLSGYVMVQTMNPMWLDGVILLPLVVLGIERLLTNRSILLYAFSLALTLITNFYIGYMTCIFSVLYVLYITFSTGKIYSAEQRQLKLWRFIYTSILACLCASFILIPSYNSLSLGKLSYSAPSFIPENKLDLFDIFTKTLINSYDTASYSGMPSLYCGTISLILLPIYFISDKESIRRKVCGAVLIGILILSMSVTTLDLIWHGFQYPNWMNYRYSYMLIFMVLALCSRAFRNIEPVKIGTVVKILLILLLLLAIIQAEDYGFISGLGSIWASIIFLSVYGIIICLPGSQKRKLTVLLLITVMLELSVNTAESVLDINRDVGYSKRSSYADFVNKYDDLSQQSDGFYRTVKTENRTLNDDMSLDLKGITHSSSTLNRNAINVLRNMGYSSREHWTKYKGGTEVSDALLGIKYVINNECKITENPYALDIIQPIENELDECEVKNENPFIYQNDIYRSLSGIDKSVWQECEINGIWSENLKKKTFGKNVRYTPIDNTKNSYIIFDAEAQKTGEIYCFFPTDYEQYANISVNGRFITEYFDYNNYHIVSLGSYSEGERLNIRLTLLSDTVWLKNSEYFYTIDKSVLNEMTNTINRSKGTAKLKNDHTIEGSFTLNTDGSVYTSIPYEPGWIIKIDGETVDYYSFADGLIAFNVQSGNHEYEMKYIPPGFISGIIISALAVAAVLLLEKYRKTHLQKHI